MSGSDSILLVADTAQTKHFQPERLKKVFQKSESVENKTKKFLTKRTTYGNMNKLSREKNDNKEL